jgi:hypothetical protein
VNQPRKPAQVATGSVSFTATAGAVLDVDTLLQASDGRTYKVTTARTTVNGSNTTTIAALDAGSLGNADAGLALNPVQPIAGVVGSSFVVLAPASVVAWREKPGVVALAGDPLLSRDPRRFGERLRDLGAGSAGCDAGLVSWRPARARHSDGVHHA